MEVLYFTATWCAPCKVFGPIMEKVGEDHKVRKIDIEQEQETTAYYGVLSVPTVILINKEDTEVGRFVGARTESWVRDFIEKTGEIHDEDTLRSVE